MATVSSFLAAGPTAAESNLALLQLQRDVLVSVHLAPPDAFATSGYAEGQVTNTRFGSFPHSTLVGQPWGSQILASKVDTGSRGNRKRKRDDAATGEDADRDKALTPTSETPAAKAAIVAGTGFAHLFPPTPETWTISLPHRTQVVYTADYSYILQRMRVCPGSRLIEAGAGSGSFTHAAVRAVFNGSTQAAKAGHVYSYEYHEPRADALRLELDRHGLRDVVTVTHRDVYQEGFHVDQDGPNANAIFLDLPAPWLALRHLTRRRIGAEQYKALTQPLGTETRSGGDDFSDADSAGWVSPLDPKAPVAVCTFTPCIEQVQSVVAALRQLGWVDVEMVEIIHRRFEIRRERVGYAEEGLRGSNSGPKDVDEAMGRLLEVGQRFKSWGEEVRRKADGNGVGGSKNGNGEGKQDKSFRQQRQEKNRAEERERKLYNEGTLVNRWEPEFKNHTSYLVFAMLPVEWTEQDEELALEKWGNGVKKTEDQTEGDKKNGEAQ